MRQTLVHTPLLPAAQKDDMKKLSLMAVFASAVLVATPAFALGGCANSPENPTLVLAGLAGGVYGFRSLRTYLRARRDQ